MGHDGAWRIAMLGIIAAVTTGLAGCSSADSGSILTPNEGRTLTVVKDGGRKPNDDVAVSRIHRLEGAAIAKWLSDDKVSIILTKMTKAATQTEEAKFEYFETNVDLLTDSQGQLLPLKEPSAPGATVRETVSPGGKLAFIQEWHDKYTASNYVLNLTTQQRIEVKVDNYLEKGSWLDEDTYILAAGSMNGRGELYAIQADGRSEVIPLHDPDVETFEQFEAGHDRIYYVDGKQTLKAFALGDAAPTTLVKGAGEFRLSPDGTRIAVTPAYAEGVSSTKLTMYNSAGSAQGYMIGKGDLINDVAWSPDGSMLAFSVYAEEKSGMNGVYVYDSATGKVSPVGPSYFPQYPLSWNPSGTRLGVTVGGENGLPVTQIIDFKS
ncbi:PD40 domain-containing protein [Paenibacillus sp. PR3]|uniref:PD40 domain-containing protein n=1 Tax=Paenibacillus terricola TaxID=2763503 RepID=A0ABR8MX74_9BACL|nr:PD40 domain-containing protein [Paenibacillus terricola]MBD3920573.1 PD40 domain-containing protein [Paenibacillus terricola]